MSYQNQPWHYAKGTSQLGPVSFEQLRAMAAQGTLDRYQDRVWTEGMSDWKLAGDVAELFTAQVASNPYRAPAIPNPPSGSFAGANSVVVKPASFVTWILLCAVAMLTFLVGMVLMSISEDSYGDGQEMLLASGGGLLLIGGISGVSAVVLMLIYLHRAWTIIQPGFPRTTPGKAVGFLFIPIYNVYWNFQAYHGWAQDYNRYIREQGLGAPPVNEGLFLGYAILTLLGIIPFVNVLSGLASLVVTPMVFHQICRSINYFAK